MPTQRFDSLRRQLVADGIAPRYARRLTRELTQHWSDLAGDAIAAGMTPDAAERHAHEQLGTDEQIRERVKASGRFSAFGRRHPVICFLIAPPLAVMAITAAGIAVLAALVTTYRPVVPLQVDEWVATTARFAGAASVPLLCAALAASLLVYARNRCVSLYWPLAGCLTLSVVAGLLFVDIVPPTDQQRGMIEAGARVPWPSFVVPWAMLVPAATFSLFWLSAELSAALTSRSHQVCYRGKPS